MSIERKSNPYPNLSGAEIIAIDIETKDSDLLEKGPGAFRGNGDYITGISISVPNFSEYYNFTHSTNIKDYGPAYDIERNIKYVREILALNVPKLGMNLSYELSWLTSPLYDFKINGELIDVMVNDYLLYELHESYSLNNILKRNKLEGKRYDLPYQIALEKGWLHISNEVKAKIAEKDIKETIEILINNKVSIGAHLHKLKWEEIRNYALGDTELLLPLYEIQKPKIKQNGLELAAATENQMIRITNEMYQNGSRIDVEATEKLLLNWWKKIDEKEDLIFSEAGSVFNIKSNKQLAELYDKKGYKYELSDKGNPVFNAKSLIKYSDPLSKSLLTVRLLKDNAGKFPLKFLELNVDGVIHGQFHSTRNSIKGGTINSRLSSTNPNMQNIPSQNDKYRLDQGDEIAKEVRSLFIPDNGCKWGSIDLSQIEFRTLCHFGVGEGITQARNNYINNKDADYHNFVIEMTKLPRKAAKVCNFLLVYRGGHKLLAEMLGESEMYGLRLKKFYFSKLPFVKMTAEFYANQAVKERKLRSLIGRTIHFDSLESTFSAFSRLNQGSAADFLKLGLVKAWNEGLFDHKSGKLKLHSTIHDENNVSIPETKEALQAFERLKFCMENAASLKVPVYADCGIGLNWYDAKKD